jgi:hypothetical protein
LEIVVTPRIDELKRLLDLWDGTVTPPANIERVIAEVDETNKDQFLSRLSEATRTDLGDVPALMTAFTAMPAHQQLALSRRLGWTISTLTTLNQQQDKVWCRLEAALASIAAWDNSADFWKAARGRLDHIAYIRPLLEHVLRSREARASVPPDAPIWEREHLHALEEADQAEDWSKLGELSQSLPQLPHPDLSAWQAAIGLTELDWPRLVHLADSMGNWLRGHLLLRPLPLADALRLAAASRNGHVRFAALERVARREARPLLPAEETALRSLFVVLARDQLDWKKWLAFCNKYPVRYPHMQRALGRALARCDADALKGYVDSISLSTTGADMRECVTQCLTVFRGQARSERRRILWRQAFDRWASWNFGANDGDGLTDVGRCELDYGVVGWLVECEPSGSNPEQAFEDDLRSLDGQWHRSLSVASSDFFRLLSRFQVTAHARSRTPNCPDWLPGPDLRAPAAAEDPFIQRKYRWNGRCDFDCSVGV